MTDMIFQIRNAMVPAPKHACHNDRERRELAAFYFKLGIPGDLLRDAAYRALMHHDKVLVVCTQEQWSKFQRQMDWKQQMAESPIVLSGTVPGIGRHGTVFDTRNSTYLDGCKGLKVETWPPDGIVAGEAHWFKTGEVHDESQWTYFTEPGQKTRDVYADFVRCYASRNTTFGHGVSAMKAGKTQQVREAAKGIREMVNRLEGHARRNDAAGLSEVAKNQRQQAATMRTQAEVLESSLPPRKVGMAPELGMGYQSWQAWNSERYCDAWRDTHPSIVAAWSDVQKQSRASAPHNKVRAFAAEAIRRGDMHPEHYAAIKKVFKVAHSHELALEDVDAFTKAIRAVIYCGENTKKRWHALRNELRDARAKLFARDYADNNSARELRNDERLTIVESMRREASVAGDAAEALPPWKASEKKKLWARCYSLREHARQIEEGKL